MALTRSKGDVVDVSGMENSLSRDDGDIYENLINKIEPKLEIDRYARIAIEPVGFIGFAVIFCEVSYCTLDKVSTSLTKRISA